MLKPSAVLARILSLLLLPPAAAALSSAELMQGPGASVAAFAASAPVTRDAQKNNHRDYSDERANTATQSPLIRGKAYCSDPNS
jgi:hypothetical protein